MLPTNEIANEIAFVINAKCKHKTCSWRSHARLKTEQNKLPSTFHMMYYVCDQTLKTAYIEAMGGDAGRDGGRDIR